MQTSAVPAAIAALLDICRNAPGLDGVTVVDGPPTVDMSDADLVAVGWAPGGDGGAELVQDFAYAGARSRDEDFSVTFWVESWSGDDDIAARRARAFELLAAIETAIRATGPNPEAPTLGGAVLWAHLTRAQLQQIATDQGARVGITGTVTCRARI
ncbi:hypothetical protein ACFXKG_18535 [Streptomyces sp. NPDC059255]|uniref:hypothetical protein n=1 Tax=Streptomyces sp. NPDC059255 TaxID=3346793 RepID=UPI00368A9DFA